MARRLKEIAAVDVREELAEVCCPVLYLRGARDRLVGPSALATIREVLPTIEVATADAPHLVVQRQPEQSARLIAEFVRAAR